MLRRKAISVRMYPELWARVRVAARQARRTLSEYVDEALNEKMAKQLTENQKVHSTRPDSV